MYKAMPLPSVSQLLAVHFKAVGLVAWIEQLTNAAYFAEKAHAERTLLLFTGGQGEEGGGAGGCQWPHTT